MRKLFILSVQVLLSCLLGVAQTTVTSGTVVDSDSTAWANGTVTVDFVVSPTFPNPALYTVNGAPLSFSVIHQVVTLDGSGHFSLTVYDNTRVSPIGSQWRYTVCPNASTKCGILVTGIAGSTQNLSTAITAAIPAPRFQPLSGSFGYNDTEAQIQLLPGSTYFNTTSSTQRLYSGSGWSDVSGTVISLPVSIANGGTGQVTAAAGLAALGGLTANGITTSSNGGGSINVPGTGTFGTLVAGAIDNDLHPAQCANAIKPSWCSGADIGAWTNAAIQASSLTVPSTIVIDPGTYNIAAQIVIDRPVTLRDYGAQLNPTSALNAAQVVVPVGDVTITAGSAVVAVTNTTGLAAGMSISGYGIQPGTHINSIVPNTSITLSRVPYLHFLAAVTQSNVTIANFFNMQGLAVGQTLFCGQTSTNLCAGLTVASIVPATQSITVSGGTPTGGSTTPMAVNVTSTWATALTAEQDIPIALAKYNPSALHNAEGQMVGGGIYGLWLWDTSTNSLGYKGRSVNVDGIQVSGWDRFLIQDFRCDSIKGRCLIYGGGGAQIDTTQSHVEVRESQVKTAQMYDSGDWTVGAAVLEDMTPGASSPDENNTNYFLQISAVCSHGSDLAMGTNVVSRQGTTNGPRIEFFDQVHNENCEHVSAPGLGSQNLHAPPPNVWLMETNNLSFNQSFLDAGGYGQGIFRIDVAQSVNFMNGYLNAAAPSVVYTVGVTNGSKNVTYVSGGFNGGFDPTGQWDGVGAQTLDGGTCVSACNVYLQTAGAVASDSQSLQLASNYTGTTNTAATLTIYTGGPYFDLGTQSVNFVALNGFANWSDSSTSIQSLLNATASELFIPGYFLSRFIEDRGQTLTIQEPTTFGNPVTIASTLGVTGKTTTAASTTSAAGLNIAQGTAPSSPVNGDCWTTSAGLYCYINGGTVGPYSSNITTVTPTVNQAACVKAAGPPVVIGYCSTVVGAGGACTCN